LLKYIAVAVLVGCGTNGVDESDLTGTYQAVDNCENGTLVIASDQSITFNSRVATNVMIDGVRMDQTETPNVTFIIDYTLGGEGGHIHWMFQLWMDHDGGSGSFGSSVPNCAVTLTRVTQ
jgi:hypothetical protein